MSNYELTISANDNTVVSLKINNRKSIFFGSKKFILKPGETFEYTSGTPLNSSSGLMLGSYFMTNEKGNKFEVKIPAFSLDIPNSKKIKN